MNPDTCCSNECNIYFACLKVADQQLAVDVSAKVNLVVSLQKQDSMSLGLDSVAKRYFI